MSSPEYPELYAAAHNFPAIDNHAHPLLKDKHRQALPFEGLISEAEGEAQQDSVHTVACLRATHQLSELYKLDPNTTTWSDIKAARDKIGYEELCETCFKPTGIRCILIDDGLVNTSNKLLAEEYHWHDRFTPSPSKRLVRVEAVAEVSRCLTSVLFMYSLSSLIGRKFSRK